MRNLYDCLRDESCWVFGCDLKVKFWHDNLFGHPLVELVNLENQIWDPYIFISSVTSSLGGIVILSFICQIFLILFKLCLFLWLNFNLLIDLFGCLSLWVTSAAVFFIGIWEILCFLMIRIRYFGLIIFHHPTLCFVGVLFLRCLPIDEVFRHRGFSFLSRCPVCKRY